MMISVNQFNLHDCSPTRFAAHQGGSQRKTRRWRDCLETPTKARPAGSPAASCTPQAWLAPASGSGGRRGGRRRACPAPRSGWPAAPPSPSSRPGSGDLRQGEAASSHLLPLQLLLEADEGGGDLHGHGPGLRVEDDGQPLLRGRGDLAGPLWRLELSLEHLGHWLQELILCILTLFVYNSTFVWSLSNRSEIWLTVTDTGFFGTMI